MTFGDRAKRSIIDKLFDEEVEPGVYLDFSKDPKMPNMMVIVNYVENFIVYFHIYPDLTVVKRMQISKFNDRELTLAKSLGTRRSVMMAWRMWHIVLERNMTVTIKRGSTISRGEKSVVLNKATEINVLKTNSIKGEKFVEFDGKYKDVDIIFNPTDIIDIK